MNDDFIENIWQQFAIETEEHLEIMEEILVAADSNLVDASEVARLFRSFHSIKGIANALEMLGMGQLSHSAEDLLGLVREGNAQLDQTTAALLLEAVDQLKELRAQAVAERSDGGAPAQLITQLKQTFARANGVDTETVVTTSPANTATPNYQQVALHEDTEMLKLFMELLRENIPALSNLLPPTEQPLNAEVHAQLNKTLATLDHAANVMGFTRLNQIIQALLAQLSSADAQAPDSHATNVDLLRQLQDLLLHLEHESGEDAGSQLLGACLTDTLTQDFEQLIHALCQHLNDFLTLDTERSLIAEHIFNDLNALNALLAFLLPDLRLELILLAEDVYGRIARADFPLDTDITVMTEECISLIRQLINARNTGDLATQTVLINACEALATRFREHLWHTDNQPDNAHPKASARALIEQLNITPELLEILSPENVHDLLSALDKGETIYEIMAHLESSEELAADFLMWIEKNGRLITNRSIFIDDQSWYEMLLVSPLSRAQLHAEILNIDPEASMLQIKNSDLQTQATQATPILTTQQDAPTPAKPTSATSSTAATTTATQSIRVAGETLDNFMNQIGEMVLLRAQLNHIVTNTRAREALLSFKNLLGEHAHGTDYDTTLTHIYEALDEQHRKLIEVDTNIQTALAHLQDHAMSLRVMPVEMVFKRFPRVVRDLAQAQGKQIRLTMSGQEVRIDKAMVEILADPLMHMVRNSADHGIEMPEVRRAAGKNPEANITINAIQQGSRVIVQVIDDGCGIDPEKIRAKAIERGLLKAEDSLNLSTEELYNFLFMPGFSTAQEITEISGRGVGMDVVRTNVMRLGGAIHIKSSLGKGSTFSLEMPLSVAVQDVMLVNAGQQTLALPGRFVAEMVEVPTDAIQTIKGRPAMLLRGAFLPLAHLGDLLGFTHHALIRNDLHSRSAVVLSNGQQMIGLVIDSTIGRRELFVKDIHARLAALPGVGGAAIMGDGKVVLILDGEILLKLAESVRVES